jgi:hypothetical protein
MQGVCTIALWNKGSLKNEGEVIFIKKKGEAWEMNDAGLPCVLGSTSIVDHEAAGMVQIHVAGSVQLAPSMFIGTDYFDAGVFKECKKYKGLVHTGIHRGWIIMSS